MTGSEPFLQSGFVELCARLAQKHLIHIGTNLSTESVYDFAEQIPADRVDCIHASLHIDERLRLKLLDDFIEKYRLLEKRGFTLYVNQVMYPPVLRRFPEIHDLLRSRGIIVKPKTFRGYYGTKKYPESYSEEERGMMMRYRSLAESDGHSTGHLNDPSLDEFLSGDLSFKGLLCGAGKDSVVIWPDGETIRCLGERTRIGNIFRAELDLFVGRNRARLMCVLVRTTALGMPKGAPG
jgi:hypothetical protein